MDYTGSSGQTTGPSLLLKVMAGDTIMPGVQCYYVSNTLTTTNSSFNTVLGSLASGIMGTTAGTAEGNLSGYTSSSGTVFSGLTSFLSTNDPAPPSGYPKAYLNWILLDDQFNYVSSSSGSVAAASITYTANQMNTVAASGPVIMARNGYLYVWVSNETQGWDVFFDNFSVQYKQGPVLEENHYYPFGLTMAGISDHALKTNYATNKYRWNKVSELQNKEFSDGSGLEMYETQYRMVDPQLGRFWQIDPRPNPDYSQYASMTDNPILHNDHLGDSIIGKANNAIANRIETSANNKIGANNNKITTNNSGIKTNIGKLIAAALGGKVSSKDIAKAVSSINSLTKANRELIEKNSNLAGGINAIQQMRTDIDHNYSFESPANDDGTHHVTQGDGKNVNVEGSNDGLFFHEMRHVSQSLNAGGLRFSSDGLLFNASNTLAGQLGNEAQAYRTEYSYDGTFPGHASNIFGINLNSVSNITDLNGKKIYLPGNKLNLLL